MLQVSFEPPVIVDFDNLGGRLHDSITLRPRIDPYVVRADLTVMPETTLTILPGVVMEFAPNVGILVLGTLNARGDRGNEIVMRPILRRDNWQPRPINGDFVNNHIIKRAVPYQDFG